MEANIKVEDDWFTFNDDELVKEYNYLEKHVSLKEENEIIDVLEKNPPVKNDTANCVSDSAIEQTEEILLQLPVNPNQDMNTAGKTKGGAKKQISKAIDDGNEHMQITKRETRSRKSKDIQKKTKSEAYADEGDLGNSIDNDCNYELDNNKDTFEPTVDDSSSESDSDDDVEYVVKQRSMRRSGIEKKSGTIPKKDAPNKEKDKSKDEINFMCTLCSFESDDRISIVNHGYSEHLEEIGQNKYEIKLSMNEKNRKQFDQNTNQNAEELTTKSLEKKSKSFFCKECDFKTSLESLFEQHINLNHYRTSKQKMKYIYACMYCSFKFPNKRSIVNHIGHMHKKANVVHKCEYCSYEHRVKDQLIQHLKNKHGPKSLCCDYCSYQTTSKSTLKLHINASHTKEIKYKCPQCPFVTFRLATCRIHEAVVHTKLKVYNCTQCTFFTFSSSSLRRHISVVHLKKTLYDCKDCDYKTADKGNLNTHINTQHTKERIYPCKLCPYKCFDSSNLIRHNQTHHTKTKPILCSICGHKFTLNALLRKHINVKHTKENFYHCLHCDYIFKSWKYS